MEYEIYNSSDELAHWGVRGMRWGVRRYQNKDGSLTAAGRRRIKAETDKLRAEEQVLKNRRATKAKFDRLAARRKSVEEQKKELDDADAAANDKKSRRAAKAAAKAAAKQTKKSMKDMTDEELLAAVNRSRLEEQYRQLNPEKKTMMKTLMSDVVAPAATNAGRQFLQNALSKMGENMLKGKVDPNSIEALKKTYEKLDLQKKIEKLKSGIADELSVEDQNKQTRLKWDTEDRKARSEGYKDWADKVNKSRQENEARSRAEYEKANGTYHGVGTTSRKAEQKARRTALLLPDSSSSSRNLPAAIQNKPVSNISDKTVKTGRSAIAGLLDAPISSNSSSYIGDVDKDGNFIPN